jgi:hypothetical protein
MLGRREEGDAQLAEGRGGEGQGREQVSMRTGPEEAERTTSGRLNRR